MKFKRTIFYSKNKIYLKSNQKQSLMKRNNQSLVNMIFSLESKTKINRKSKCITLIESKSKNNNNRFSHKLVNMKVLHLDHYNLEVKILYHKN